MESFYWILSYQKTASAYFFHIQFNQRGFYCKFGRCIDPHHSTRVPSTPHHSTRVPSTPHMTQHYALRTAVHLTVFCSAAQAEWDPAVLSINTERQTFSRRQTGLFYCAQWRYIVVRVDVVVDSKQQRQKYIVMLTARMFNVKVTSCSATVIIPSWRKNRVLQRYGQSIKQCSFCCLPKTQHARMLLIHFLFNLLFPISIQNWTPQTEASRRDLWQLLLSDLYKNLRNVRVSSPPGTLHNTPPTPARNPL